MPFVPEVFAARALARREDKRRLDELVAVPYLGTFARQITGKLLPGASADWHAVLADGNALGGLDWLNKCMFFSVGGRQPGGVIYETYLVR